MKLNIPSERGSPYSALLCIVMLLMAGMLVKFGAAIQLAQLSH